MTKKELSAYVVMGRVIPVLMGLGVALFFTMSTNLYSIAVLLIALVLFVIHQAQYENKFQKLLKTLP